jgi:uncharacterized protein DUF6599
VLKIHLLVSVLLLFALPAETGKFKRVKSGSAPSETARLAPEATPVETEQAEYVAGNGERFAVEILTFQQEGKAYEFFSQVASAARAIDANVEISDGVGVAGFTRPNEIAFFKGVHFVKIINLKPGANADSLTALAQSLSDTLDKGDGEIPVLIKHLPNPNEAQKNAVYLNSFKDLTRLMPQPVLTAVKGDGNADAAYVSFTEGNVLIVEYNTPQLASENDQRIIARIQELWRLGQPAPTAYKRVGNYSVFVFNAPDEQTAKQLIDQVHYEQVVSWLGENPNILRRAEERYIDTTLGVLVTVLKASGYALIGCLGIGGLVGALLFSYRRSQQKAFTAYSDAGGMMRLNLDELTGDKNR